MNKVMLIMPDLHSDLKLAGAARTFTQKHNAPALYTGDYIDDRMLLEAISRISQAAQKAQEAQKAEDEKKTADAKKGFEKAVESAKKAEEEAAEAYDALDRILKEHACGAYGVLGNHDLPEIAGAHLKSLTRLEGKITEICGQAHYGIKHFSASPYEQNPHEGIPAELEKLRKVMDGIDVAVMHEGAHELLSHEKKMHDKTLADALAKSGKEIVCGHVHTPFLQLEGQKLIRPGCGENGKEGMVYVKVFFPEKYVLLGMEIEKFKAKYSS